MKRTGRFEQEKNPAIQETKKKKPVTLLEVFRLHSGEVNDVYHRQLHREKDFLRDRGFSPKHRQSAQESDFSRRKSILMRTESADQVSSSTTILLAHLEINEQELEAQKQTRPHTWVVRN